MEEREASIVKLSDCNTVKRGKIWILILNLNFIESL